LDAIRLGFWDFEPPEASSHQFDCTDAMPGTEEKLEVLAERLRCGLPLWHPLDRDDMESPSARGRKPR
jgi:hypothetical protein